MSAPPGAGADLLRGPDVLDQRDATIVRRTMRGDFLRVEGRPELAAIEALPLDPATLERARGLALERTVRLSMFLVDEIDAVRAYTDEIAAGNNDQARRIIRALHKRFDPGTPRDPLTKRYAELLDDAQHTKYARVLGAYWTAWVNDELGQDGDDPGPGEIEHARERLAFRLFQEELRDAYEISLRHYRRALDAIYDAVSPTEAQRAAIRSIVIEHIKRTRLDATTEERRDAMLEIYRSLDEERREKLFGYMVRVALPQEG